MCIVIGGLLISCSPSPLDPADADFHGTVNAVRLVQGGADIKLTNVSPAQGSSTKVVLVGPTTEIRLLGANRRESVAELSDVSVGAVVAVKTSGTEYRSDPPQYEATWIAITR